MSDIDEQLRTLAIEVKRSMDLFPSVPVRPYHLIPDLGILELCGTILDQAQATVLLFLLRHKHACFPNIRAGFEASQDLLLLLTSEDQAYVASRFRAAEIMDRARVVAAAHAWDHRQDSRAYEEAAAEGELNYRRELEYDAVAWDRYRPGAYALFMSAAAEVERDRSRRKYHWSGLSRTQIAQQLEKAVGADQTALWDQMMYAFLTHHTHPSYGGGARNVVLGDASVLPPSEKVDDDPLYDAALDAIIMAASVAADALDALHRADEAIGDSS